MTYQFIFKIVITNSYKATPTKGSPYYQAKFQIESKILINCPLKRGHPSYKANFSLQKGCPHQFCKLPLIETCSYMTNHLDWSMASNTRPMTMNVYLLT